MSFASYYFGHLFECSVSTKGGCEFLCEFCIKNILVTCLNVIQCPPKVGVSVFYIVDFLFVCKAAYVQ